MITMNGTSVMEFTETELKYINIALETELMRREDDLEVYSRECDVTRYTKGRMVQAIEQIEGVIKKVSSERRKIWESEKEEDDAL